MNTGIIDLHGGDTHPGEQTPGLVALKVSFIFLVFAIAVVFGVLPAKVKSCKESPRFLGIANAFSGGLFLSIALIHILPEAAENFETWWMENNEG